MVKLLNDLVLKTEQCRRAEAAGKLIRIPTGDGMALVFFTSPDAPVRCAIELARADQSEPRLELRMGLHSGPVDQVSDVNARSNVTGAGINMAQRVMDCGDAGHILLSKRLADDLSHYSDWNSQLHDLGEVEVKHGVKIGIVNFVEGDVGNASLPEKIRRLRQIQGAAGRRRKLAWSLGALAALAVLGAVFWIQSHRAAPPQTAAGGATKKSIAVLPFENMSDDKGDSFFADGIQDDVLTSLGKIKELTVREGRRWLELENYSVVEKNDAAANLALIYARIGETDEAIKLIEKLLTLPGNLDDPAIFTMTQADLKLRWVWDPLRDNPRFQKIVEGPEPKTIY